MDFNISNKDAIISLEINLSIKEKAPEGTSDKVLNFLQDLELLIDKHSTDDNNIFIRKSVGNTLTHKEKASK